MSEIVNQSLQKMAKATGIIFAGTIIGMFLGFISNIIIVRYLSIGEYGLFSLALTVVGIAAALSPLGLTEGAPRYIAYYRGKGRDEKVAGVVSSTLLISLIMSLLFFIVLFLSSDVISMGIFHDHSLSWPLRLLSISLPFYVLTQTLISIFRGFSAVREKVYFENVLPNVLKTLFFVAVVIFNLSLVGVVWAWISATMITFATFVAYSLRRLRAHIRTHGGSEGILMELLSFSLPLFGQSVLSIIITSTDKLMLGYFKTQELVGQYAVALSLTSLISVVLISLAFIYIPVVSQLYAKHLLEEIGNVYAVLTKWIFSASLPIFLMLFLFPAPVLSIIYGEKYMQAGVAVQILALGFITHNFLGPNGMTLIVVGKTKVFLVVVLVQTVMNVVLNLILIPQMGIAGAAIASTISLTIANILFSAELYAISKVHPFRKSYLKLAMISLSLVIVFSTFIKSAFASPSVWMLVLFFVFSLATYCLLMLLTRSLDNEDIALLLAVEEKTGVNLRFVERVMRRFM